MGEKLTPRGGAAFIPAQIMRQPKNLSACFKQLNPDYLRCFSTLSLQSAIHLDLCTSQVLATATHAHPSAAHRAQAGVRHPHLSGWPVATHVT